MMKTLRILFTILSALCVAAVIPIGSFFGFYWALAVAGAALLFFGLMLACKRAQEAPEEAKKEDEALKKQFDNLKE